MTRFVIGAPTLLRLLAEGQNRLQHLRQEGPGAFVLRVGEHLLRVPGLHHDAVVHEDEGVAHLPGEAHLVRDHDHRHARLRQAPHDVEHLADQLGVQGGRRLAEQHQFGFHGQAPGEPHPLLLPARELAPEGLHAPRAPHPPEQGGSALTGGVPGHALDPAGRRHDRLQGGHVREQVEPREHHADVLPLRSDFLVLQLVELAGLLPVADEMAVHPEPTGVDLLQVVDAAQERRLARPGGADHAHHLAGRDLQIDPLQHVDVPEGLAHALGPHHGRAGTGLQHVGQCSLPTDSASRAARCARVSRAPNPRLNRFSRKYWPTISRLVSARYQRIEATAIGMIWKVRLPIALSWKLSSLVTGTAISSDVSLSIAMVSLPVGGMITRIAWGSTIRRMVVPRLMPRALAASAWPGSTDWMPARTISAM